MEFNAGYDDVFLDAEKMPDIGFETFRTNPKFAFAVAQGLQASSPDYESLGVGFLHAIPSIMMRMLTAPKPQAGYSEALAYHPYDVVDCRHAMMMSFLFKSLNGEIFPKTIIEIGGGFGNWVRLAAASGYLDKCNTWSIIDYPFMLGLQKWYLEQCNLMDYTKIELVPIDSFAVCTPTDLVIAAHSLSEISIVPFMKYVNIVLEQAKYFFYARSNTRPSVELIQVKEKIINEHFDTINQVLSEGGNVLNTLYKKKGI